MALDEMLLSILEDPIDHGPLIYVAADEVLYNPRRRVQYAVRDNIPVMLPDEAQAVDDETHARYVA